MSTSIPGSVALFESCLDAPSYAARQLEAVPTATFSDAYGREAGAGPELSVIVPTRNEAGNVEALYRALVSALVDIDWEMILVDDDSRDGTVEIARRLGQTDFRVRCIRRIGRRGLAGAVLEGWLSSSAYAVAVIDADMQHDERLLPRMLQVLRDGADIAIGTRHAQGGSSAGGFSAWRRWLSENAARAARTILPAWTSDPMSGFFMLRRDEAERLAPKLSAQGFKILLDVLVSAGRPLRIAEFAYDFRPRHAGQSKLDSAVMWEFAGLLVAKASGDRISARFLAFGLVGLSGLAVHLMVLQGLLIYGGISFDAAQLVAAVGAMTWNFALNNAFTYRDRRLQGWRMLTGLLSFYAVCSIGAVANVGVASWIYGREPTWWLAGGAGAIMGAVFNYAATASITWKRT